MNETTTASTAPRNRSRLPAKSPNGLSGGPMMDTACSTRRLSLPQGHVHMLEGHAVTRPSPRYNRVFRLSGGLRDG
jgi:hypothetical protein